MQNILLIFFTYEEMYLSLLKAVPPRRYYKECIGYVSNSQNYPSTSSWTREAHKRIQEYARLWRARHLLDAISLINELFTDSSEVEILSLADVIIRKLKYLGVLEAPKNDLNDIKRQVLLSNNGHTGVFHCCTFCSSGGKKDVICACGGRMPGGYNGCGHGHIGHPGINHWSCCGSILLNGNCLIAQKYKYKFLL